ncbi:MAG: hypothetical protein K9I69_05155 [Ignavibacteriales bacterium]|nr:hypothetical protein [Ignavibacteriales bacterium]MCF8306139.1 hypothetical protein [Ignavibacteriales bacterium]MCF8315807.1 hypothetical protein [Ignavibacteriales bacterium]MCF8437267.1 hypothetical protein [Ignavibacteriales bacterium]
MSALILIGIISVIVFIWSTVMIYSFLEKRDKDIESFIFINFHIFRYVSNYRQITRTESGKTGYLFYLWVSSINCALVCSVLIILLTI